jgi:hypothetical protein
MAEPSKDNPCYDCGDPGRSYTLNYVDCDLCDSCAESHGVKVEEYHPNEVRCNKTEDMFG